MTFGAETDEAEAHRQLDTFVDHGGTLIDTADVYSAGASEEMIGRWGQRRGGLPGLALRVGPFSDVRPVVLHGADGRDELRVEDLDQALWGRAVGIVHHRLRLWPDRAHIKSFEPLSSVFELSDSVPPGWCKSVDPRRGSKLIQVATAGQPNELGLSGDGRARVSSDM